MLFFIPSLSKPKADKGTTRHRSGFVIVGQLQKDTRVLEVHRWEESKTQVHSGRLEWSPNKWL